MGSPSQPSTQKQPLTQQQQQIVAQIESDAVGQAPDAEDYSWQTLEMQPQADGLLVTASIYTLRLPSDWAEHCVIEETDRWLSIYSKENQEAGYGGLLCTIGWTDAPEVYSGMPNCQLLGQVTIDHINYDVVADIITDPQAPTNGTLYTQYLQMQQALPEILKTIDFGPDALFTPVE